MKIITHPANKHLIDSKIEQIKQEGISFIFGSEIIFDQNMEKDKPTGKYKILGNKFFSWWNGEGKPPSWAIYCGFIEEIREPLFYVINNRSLIFNPFSFAWGIRPETRILTNYAC